MRHQAGSSKLRKQRAEPDYLDDDADDDIDAPRARWWSVAGSTVVRRPKDAVALFVLFVGAAFILANALFMQSGPHPAPIFANFAPPVPVKEIVVRQDDPVLEPTQGLITASFSQPDAPRVSTGSVAAQPSSKQNRADPIGDLVARTNRLLAMQKALTAFGYGQIVPTGAYDAKTKAAIERFQRDRHLPVTGQVSDALYAAVGQMAGRTLD